MTPGCRLVPASGLRVNVSQERVTAQKGLWRQQQTTSQTTSPQAPEAAKKPHVWGRASRKATSLRRPIKSTVSCTKTGSQNNRDALEGAEDARGS